ncbi:DAK2 domain-containing protein [Priestia megaterium]|uniref:DAK2 domain-containing protein n=1 Tax=Priestia megaterium TaxID=1404 RepID=UPI002E210D4E|nr:DAK2 domain-containing protein [Priestia megaterium]MED4252022.1 DAK2 domain-containing protein [Priestia megaterium]MED4264704.1 DAK2 domain-containing protein [Priestia megaterium]MED4277594.1 DAK2 domain-containing protein [Priestia megaterium]MED4317865.1 DAK2 domain-containing protein [Priestia megaterium]
MSMTTLDGKRFREMVLQGAQHLSNNADYVDALNVFPVPDGDTGTNMNLSITSGAKEVKNNLSDHIGQVSQALSKGLLMGARGNSGVILSQLFRGFAKSVEQKSAITTVEFAEALELGVETAYKAVMKPIEGTILTVAKDTAKKAAAVAKKQSDMILFMEEVLKEANASLNRTPDLLPVLKEVGVVDSGGQGLVLIYEGFLAELKGEKLPGVPMSAPSMNELVNAEHHKHAQSHMNTEDIEFGYCTEFMVRLEEDKPAAKTFSEETFRQDLSKWGDSLLVVSDDEIVKVHIHAEHPGEVLNYGQQYGSLIKMKIENMREQHSSIVSGEEKPAVKNAEKQPFGIVTVSMGKGIAELFKSLGATVVIEGGQTMNPSTEDIVKAIEETNAEQVLILPNNGNIVMAANQAAAVAGSHVSVVPSKTVPQGMTALLSFNPQQSLKENEEVMTEALQHVKTGQVTYAVRDTNIDGLELAKGDFMGIAEKKIVVKDSEKLEAAKKLLTYMIDDEAEILTILQGEDVSDDEAEALTSFVEETFEEVEVELHKGDQPLYSYIFAIE